MFISLAEQLQPMKLNGVLSRNFSRTALLVLGLLSGAGLPSVSTGATYQVGTVITNFTVYLRRNWTNDSGRIFRAGMPVQLTDFSGSILFVEFFDPT